MPTICPTRLRGLSEAYGSWKTICISPRRGRSSRLLTCVMSRPSNLIEPSVGSSNRTRQRPSVVLPQPDSPTRPSVFPDVKPERDVVDRVHAGHLVAEHDARPDREVQLQVVDG